MVPDISSPKQKSPPQKSSASQKKRTTTKQKKSKADQHVKNLKQKQGYMPFTDHLEEARKRILRALAGVGVSSLICLFFYEFIWRYVMGPLAELIRYGKTHNVTIEIVTTRMQDDFLIQFKVVLMVGILIAIPYILFELWNFILPALEMSHRKFSYAILVASVILFGLGTSFAHVYIWPLVIKFFLFEWLPPPLPASDGSLIYSKKFLSIPDYLSFFLSFHFAFGISFQLPVVSVILALLGVVNSGMFLRSWRVAIVAMAVVSAILTPADWVSMVALMVPLVILFFLSAFFVFLIEKGFVSKGGKSPIII